MDKLKLETPDMVIGNIEKKTYAFLSLTKWRNSGGRLSAISKVYADEADRAKTRDFKNTERM